MIFGFKEFYPSISKELQGDATKLTKQHITVNKETLTIIQHARKSLLYNQETPWQKKNTSPFNVTVGAYDGADVYELVGLFRLKKSSSKFNINDIGLY